MFCCSGLDKVEMKANEIKCGFVPLVDVKKLKLSFVLCLSEFYQVHRVNGAIHYLECCFYMREEVY